MPTLTQLEYIVTVERLKHFGNAARACHVSQPSLSMQIMKVEDEVGIKIFDRLKKPVLATEKGRRFIEQAKTILREHKKLLDLAKNDAAQLSGDFRLAIIPTLTPYLLPLFIEDFSLKCPNVRLKVDELKTEVIIRELNEDALDAAILATPLNESGIRERPLFYEPFSLYVNATHPLARTKRIREKELDGSDMWLLQDGHCLRNQVVKVCSIKREKGVFKNVHFEGGNLETLRSLIKTSRGCTLMPRLFLNTLSESEKREFVREFEHPAPHREVSLVYRRDQWKSDILDAIERSILARNPNDLPRKKIHVIGI